MSRRRNALTCRGHRVSGVPGRQAEESLCRGISGHSRALGIVGENHRGRNRRHERLELLGPRTGIRFLIPQRSVGSPHADQGPDRRHQDFGIDRMRQIPVGSALEAVSDVLALGIRRRDMQNRESASGGIGFDPCRRFVAVHLRHADVQNDEVQIGRDSGQALDTVGGLLDLEVGLLENPHDRVAVRFRVVHDEDGAL